MQKNLIFKCIIIIGIFLLAFTPYSFLNLEITPLMIFLGVVAAIFQLVLVNSVKSKALMSRFIIPLIPIAIFLLAITDGLYPKSSSGGLFLDVQINPWFSLQFAFFLFYLVALYTATINTIMCNKLADKILLILIFSICIGISFFLYYYFSPGERPFIYLYFIGYAVILAIVVLIFPKKFQIYRSQSNGDL